MMYAFELPLMDFIAREPERKKVNGNENSG